MTGMRKEWQYEEVDVPTTDDRKVHPVEGAKADPAEGGDDPASSDNKNTTSETSYILNDLAFAASEKSSVATDDWNAPRNQTTDEPPTKILAENTDLSVAKEMKRDSTIVRMMKETLVGSGSKESHDVSTSDALKIDSQKEE